MRRLAPLILSCLVALGPVSGRASATRLGTITGRVVNGNTEEGQAGVRVRLLGGRTDDTGGVGQEIHRTAVTDARGRFSFERLPTGGDRPYVLDAYRSGGLFPGSAITIPSETTKPPVIDSTLRVWPTTTNPDVIVVERQNVFVIKGKDGTVNVVESLQVVNLSEDRAYIGRGGATGRRRGPRPTLGLSVPDGAETGGMRIVDASIDAPGLIGTSTGPAITTAIPPQTMNLSFLYSLEGSTGRFDLSRNAFYPTLNLSVHAEPPFVIEGAGLQEADEKTIGDQRYRVWTAPEGADPGETIEIVATAEAEGDPVLIMGAAALGVILLAGVGIALVRRHSKQQPAPERRGSPQRPLEPAPSRDDLLVAIAELDLRYRSGELSEEQWVAQRTKLKARLARLPSPRGATNEPGQSPEHAT